MNDEKYLKLKQKSNSFSPSVLIDSLGFNEALFIACDMLNNEEWDDSLQEYATNILEELRKKYPEEWDANWNYDALLGYAYHIILKYDERYAAYKRAYNKIKPPPPQLLVAMARCCISGKPPITEEEAISLVKQAIVSVKYIEAVELLRGLYKSTGNVREQHYWEEVLETITGTGPHLPPLYQISDA
ncbi:MAG: hypothetical protein H0U27_07580 [Nitrosopumilus sp.]|nr:hypothetical protein [Nitrosopumilus sp.]